MSDLVEAAKHRWLQPTELLYLLKNWTSLGIEERKEPPVYPENGHLYFFDRNDVKDFKNDGVPWVRKKGENKVREDFVSFQTTTGETALNGLYTYSSIDSTFKRRCFRLKEEGKKINIF